MKQTNDFRTPEDHFELAMQKLEYATKLLLRALTEDRIRLITNTELEEKLHVSRRALFDYRREGILRYSEIKGRIYYEPKMVEDMLRRYRVVIHTRKKKKLRKSK